jgi:hypothetical protein
VKKMSEKEIMLNVIMQDWYDIKTVESVKIGAFFLNIKDFGETLNLV